MIFVTFLEGIEDRTLAFDGPGALDEWLTRYDAHFGFRPKGLRVFRSAEEVELGSSAVIDHEGKHAVTEHLYEELDLVLTRFRGEYCLSYAQAVGTLELLKQGLLIDAFDGNDEED